ncbi:uncharacterized protein MAM_00233 [Metarhizium album ARSEF 1941]|uniref:Uncharacterized protein n=1 Tax=Metarhizium album (strain ARSEF 1941) TaxID=1081103 RepID=A0A0B2WY89_METAS|nr:uncharacterized protein MAM_00233 [Metarhizium album ARSEF 1941]KHO01232.1 hypothetical protein MAM_00233 [Metarhizium album ARSEF 1941]
MALQLHQGVSPMSVAPIKSEHGTAGITTASSPGPGFWETIRTSYDSVYSHDEDALVYTAPNSLKAVPIEKINENSSYWESSWDSLDEFIAQEDKERSLKEQYQAMKNAEPNNVAIRKTAKFHQDNMSKHVKIREVFGLHSPYHPNQLVAKKHLPSEGLCQKELMYRVACKISDLKVLNDRGVLAMDAWHFIRWRIGRKLEERLGHQCETARNFVRTIIYKLCDEPKFDSAGYVDSVMRQAVLVSAQYQGRMSRFKIDGTKADKSAAGPVKSALPHGCTREAGRQRASRGPAQRAEKRHQRRARLAAQSGSYQGVNAFGNMQKV